MQNATNSGYGKARIVRTACFIVSAMAGAPALAFDCSKASSETDVAICGDEVARAANERMGKAYLAVRGRLDVEGRKMILEGQRAWLVYRDGRCGSGVSCLAEQSEERADDLEKTPDGTTPFFIYQPGRENSYEVRILGYRFAAKSGRAETAYNRWLDNLISGSPYGDPPDTTDPHQAYEHDSMVDMTRLDERIISAVTWSGGDTGGAHPNSWSDAFNADRKTGVMYDPAAYFDDAALSNLTADCARQVIEAQSDTYGELDEAEALKRLEENFPGAVADGVKTGPRWHFNAEGAHVRFDSYAVAPYSSGAFECLFPYDSLRDGAPNAALFAAPDPEGPAQ